MGRTTSLTSSTVGVLHSSPALRNMVYQHFNSYSTWTHWHTTVPCEHTHTHTHYLPPTCTLTSVSWPVLCIPFILPLCFTPCVRVICVCMWLYTYFVCALFCQTLVAQGTALPLNYSYPPPFLSRTHTRFPCSMVSSYSSGTLLVLAAKLVAVMDAFFSESRIQIKIGYNTGGQFTDQCYTL